MARNLISVVAGLVAWLAMTVVAGLIMRQMWPAYAEVADAMTFTLPMMLARIAIGAVATVSMGVIAAGIAQSARVSVIPGIILLLLFIPEHVQLWDKFPIWYHLAFLLTLVPLTYVGNSIARGSLRQPPAVATR